MKKILSLLSILISFSLPIFAFEKIMTIGGENGWENLGEMNGVTKGKGWFGYDSIELVTSSAKMTETTDLLLSFDGNEFYDATGNYKVVSNNLSRVNDAVKGGGAALSRGYSKGISLKGEKNSIFGHSGLMGSFLIEFWLCPSLAESGETVFSWRSSLNLNNYSQYQMISAGFFNNHIQWKFNNIFAGYKESEIFVDGISTIVPKKWSRHTISFDEETGRLEYCVDGRTESISYITKNSHENGTVCYPMLGVAAGIDICPEYTGKIDNFRIERKVDQKDFSDFYATGNERFKVDGGRFATQPILISHSAVLNEIDALMTVPDQTEVRFYVRSGDNCYGWTENFPEWIEIVPGEKLENVTGLYFQVAADLLPDGGGLKTPSITELSLKYTEQSEPLPPFTVRADAGDEKVTLTWSYSVDDNAGGYYVYYGNRPGEYLGRAAVEGASPVKAGNTTSITLTGLKNGTIYYFAISAYSKIDGRISGTLSNEVYARPSARLVLR